MEKKTATLLIRNANELITAAGFSKEPKIKDALNNLGII